MQLLDALKIHHRAVVDFTERDIKDLILVALALRQGLDLLRFRGCNALEVRNK